jgi:hypothetical protein
LAGTNTSLDSHMRTYVFSTYFRGIKHETLGDMTLEDDAAATAFARRVIFDIMRDSGESSAGWTMQITEDERSVGEIEFA